MTETGITATIEPKPHEEGGAEFKAYLVVFGLLCVFTAMSFGFNELERHHIISKYASLAAIMLVAVVKAACVAVIFMHLKWDWSKVYFIIIPVSVMSVMMVIVLMPDIVLTWHHIPALAVRIPTVEDALKISRFIRHASLVLCILAVSGPVCHGYETLFTPLQFDDPIETFTLTDQDGRKFSSGVLHGKVWVVQFFYKACTQGCTVTTEKMKELQNLVRGKPDIMLISINLNEESPEILHNLAQEVEAEPGQWYFLTGPKKMVLEMVQRTFHFTAKEIANKPPGENINHTFDLCVVDRSGHLCGHIEGRDDATVADLLLAVRGVAGSRYLLSNVNAALNFMSGVLLTLGYLAIRKRRIALHKACMLSALAASTVFLASYLYYHFAVLAGQPPRFVGSGMVRYVYFALLLSHTILAALVAPLAVTVTYFGLRNNLKRHVWLARWTLPIWLYVSATGVIVYLMLYRLYPPY